MMAMNRQMLEEAIKNREEIRLSLIAEREMLDAAIAALTRNPADVAAIQRLNKEAQERVK